MIFLVGWLLEDARGPAGEGERYLLLWKKRKEKEINVKERVRKEKITIWY